MWWVVGGIVIVAAAVRWVSGRDDSNLERGDQVDRTYTLLRRGRQQAIATAPDGPVVFKGKVSADGAALVAPISERPCVFYEVRIDDLGNLGPAPSAKDPPKTSTAVLHERQAQPFFITDDTGTAEVRFGHVADVSFVVAPHLCLQGRRLKAATAVTDAVLKLGVAPFGAIVVSEAAIFLGDTVTVAGVGSQEATPHGESVGYRQLPTRCVVRAGPNRVLGILKNKR